VLPSFIHLAAIMIPAGPLPHIPATPHELSKRKRVMLQIISGIFLAAAIIAPFAIIALMRYGR
jgi:hypothetical protein